MSGQRVEAMILVVTGVAAAGLYFMFSHLLLLLAGVFTLGIGVSWHLDIRRRKPAEAHDRQAIRALWKLTRRIPEGRLLVDPVTQLPFGVHRRQGVVNLIVPRYLNEDGTGDVLVTHHLVGSLGLPHPPPLMRHEELLRPDDHGVARGMTRRDARNILALNEATGALNVDRDEFLALTAQLERALKSRQPSRPDDGLEAG
jgi:hypothetical protein